MAKNKLIDLLECCHTAQDADLNGYLELDFLNKRISLVQIDHTSTSRMRVNTSPIPTYSNHRYQEESSGKKLLMESLLHQRGDLNEMN